MAAAAEAFERASVWRAASRGRRRLRGTARCCVAARSARRIRSPSTPRGSSRGGRSAGSDPRARARGG
eukprot:3742002-Prymnesium_polylepis.1